MTLLICPINAHSSQVARERAYVGLVGGHIDTRIGFE